MKCNKKRFKGNELLSQELVFEDRPLEEMVNIKLRKVITKIKELKIENPRVPMADEIIRTIEYDINHMAQPISRRFSILNNHFEYRLNLKNKRFHIYKSFNDKEYVSIRDYLD